MINVSATIVCFLAQTPCHSELPVVDAITPTFELSLWHVTGQKHMLKVIIYTCPSRIKTMDIQAKHSDVIREKLTRLGHLLRDLSQILSFLANNETMKPRGSRDWGHSVAVSLCRESKGQRLRSQIDSPSIVTSLMHFLN